MAWGYFFVFCCLHVSKIVYKQIKMLLRDLSWSLCKVSSLFLYRAGRSGTLLPGQLPCDHVLRRLSAFAQYFTHCNCVHNPEWTEWVAISHTNQLHSQCPTGGALTYQRRQRHISGDCIDNIEHNTICKFFKGSGSLWPKTT